MILDPAYLLLKIRRELKARFNAVQLEGKLTWASVRYYLPRGLATALIFITFVSFGSDQVIPVGGVSAEPPASRPILPRGASLPPNITAKAAYLIDLKSGFVLYDKNSLLELPPASTTKIATALVALADYGLDDVVEVPSGCSFKARVGESLMGLFPGENISVRNLLQGLLIASGSDAACALAQHHWGGEAAFVAKMNNLAVTFGLERTRFTNPSGLDDPAHSSTAQELALLTKSALENEYFRQVVGTQEANISSADGRRWHKLETTNTLLREMPGIFGVKTGYTTEAGETFVFYFARGERELLGTLLGSGDRFSDAKNLLNWALSSFVFP